MLSWGERRKLGSETVAEMIDLLHFSPSVRFAVGVCQTLPLSVVSNRWQLFSYGVKFTVVITGLKPQAEPCHVCGKLRGPTCVSKTYDTPCYITATTAWQNLGKSLQHAAHMVDIQESQYRVSCIWPYKLFADGNKELQPYCHTYIVATHVR